MNKLDIEKFEQVKKDLEFKFETNQLGIKDNFSQLLATDNYLEKYLPFRIQMMISDSIENIIDPVYSSLQELRQNKAAETLTQKSFSPSQDARDKNVTQMTNKTGLTANQ
jgi:hypothetical protein